MTNTALKIRNATTSQALTALGRNISLWQMSHKNRQRHLSLICDRREELKK